MLRETRADASAARTGATPANCQSKPIVPRKAEPVTLVLDINNNKVTGSAFLGTIGLDWQFAGVAPVRAADASALVSRNINTGAFQVYNIANNQLMGSAALGQVGSDWQLGGFAPTFSLPPPRDSSSQPPPAMDGSTSQLVQAMAGFGGGGGGGESLNTAPLSADTSQQLLTTPQHA